MNYLRKELAKFKTWIVFLLSLPGMMGLAVSPFLLIPFTTSIQAQAQFEKQEEAERLLNLCREHLGKEQFESALESCQQALSKYHEINDSSGEAKSMTNLGIAYLRNGQSERGMSLLKRALEIAREINERRVEAIASLQLGIVYISLEQYQQGTEFLQQSLAIAQVIGETDLTQKIQQLLSLLEQGKI